MTLPLLLPVQSVRGEIKKISHSKSTNHGPTFLHEVDIISIPIGVLLHHDVTNYLIGCVAYNSIQGLLYLLYPVMDPCNEEKYIYTKFNY